MHGCRESNKFTAAPNLHQPNESERPEVQPKEDDDPSPLVPFTTPVKHYGFSQKTVGKSLQKKQRHAQKNTQ